jgi:SAM-dependent methyltransferase
VTFTKVHAVLHDVPGTFPLARCDNPACEALLAAPMPTETEVASYYANYYTHEESTRAAPVKWLVRRAPWIDEWWPIPARRRELDEMLVFFGTTKPGRALEIGCGAGERLRALADAGWRVTGQDVDPLAGRLVEDRADIALLRGSLPSCDLAAASFELIGMNHVLEHVADPAALLRECWRILAPGGRLVVIGPNALGFGHRLFGRSWLTVSDPTHLAIPGPRSTQILTERLGMPVRASYTTPANADLIASGSLATHTDTWRMPLIAATLRVTTAIVVQAAARLAFRFRPATGNEIVLIAEKPVA